MGLQVERNGYSNILDMGFDIVQDLVNSGAFEVLAVDKVATSSFSRINSEYLLSPTTNVDPLAAETDQPWRLLIEFNNSDGYINVWVLTDIQITQGLEVAEYADKRQAGRLSANNLNDFSVPGSRFFDRTIANNVWTCYDGQDVDPEAIPLSYHLTWTDHGVFISTWAEGYNSAGDCFNWILIQRPVDCNTGAIIVDGKAPLMCVFSQYGMKDIAMLNDINDSRMQNSILHFTVRENDINMPTPPVSSVIPTADSFPLINPIQQTALLEDGNFSVRFLHGFSTARHIYDYKLDMICYTSADVLSQWSQPRFTVFGEATQRTYKALNSNFPDNTGMRVLVQIGGQGI